MNTPEISDKVAKAIKDREVKMRSHFSVVAEKLGLESAAVLLFLLGVLLIGLIGYVVTQSGSTEFLDFGLPGYSIFLYNFPYDILIIAVAVLIVLAYILKRFDFSYKKNFKAVIALTIIGVIIFGLGATALDISDKIRNAVVNKNFPVLSHFFRQRAGYYLKEKNAYIGEIINIDDNLLTILTPDNQEIKVTYSEKTKMPRETDFEIGQKIMVMGESKNGYIEALGLKDFSGCYWQKANDSMLRPHRQRSGPSMK